MHYVALIVGMLCLLATERAGAADPVAGKFWYQQRCAACHGLPPAERQAGTPNITGASIERVSNAIAQVSAMSRVFVSEEQKRDIVAYLQRPLEVQNAPFVDYSDVWWNPAESGWGLTITQRANSKTVVLLYLYEELGSDRGKQQWLLGSGMQWLEPNRITGALVRTRSAGFPASGFAASSVQLATVGSVTLTFSDANRGSIEFSIDGVQYRKPIERFRF